MLPIPEISIISIEIQSDKMTCDRKQKSGYGKNRDRFIRNKWSGLRMRQEWMDIFSQEGYRFCKVKPEETGVFYKYYEEGFHLVMLIDAGAGCLPTPEQLQVMQERVQELFYHPVGRLQDFPEGFPVYHVELLTILLTDQSENARGLCAEGKNIWLYIPQRKQLIIYENQPGDFWGLKKKIEDMDVRQSTQTSAPVKGKHSVGKLPFVTGVIALVNILVYIILSFGGATENALYMASHGAMYPEFITVNHQWWRLLTAMFLHFGAAHLMNNMVIFCCVGSRLEKYIGHWKLAVVYFVSGIGGGLLSYAMMLMSGDYAVSGGASGAIFGVIGGLLWVVIYHRGRLEGMTTKGILLMIALSLYFGFTSTGVDNWCHVGGMLCGFFTALILYHGKRQKY